MKAKYGALDFALPGLLVDNVRIAHEIGLEGLELSLRSIEGRAFLLEQKRFRDYYMEEGEKYGITYPSIAVCETDVYGMRHKFNSPKGRKIRDIIDIAVDVAQDMKMQMIMLPSFNDSYISTEEDMEHTAEALIYACRQAARYGITITTENLLPIGRNLKLFELVDQPNFSCLYDSQNYRVWEGWHCPTMLRQLADHNILYPEIHVKDGMGHQDSSALLGQGDTDFYGTMDVLKEIDYQGWLHLENFYDRQPLCHGCTDFIETAKKDLEILKTAVEA